MNNGYFCSEVSSVGRVLSLLLCSLGTKCDKRFVHVILTIQQVQFINTIRLMDYSTSNIVLNGYGQRDAKILEKINPNCFYYLNLCVSKVNKKTFYSKYIKTK